MVGSYTLYTPIHPIYPYTPCIPQCRLAWERLGLIGGFPRPLHSPGAKALGFTV